MKSIEQDIGEAAGKIWKALNAKGPMSISGIAKATGLSTQAINQGIGWLAREEKLASQKKGKNTLLCLKE
jgi:DNA-binding transcriptional regulator GbsR (MarR family)